MIRSTRVRARAGARFRWAGARFRFRFRFSACCAITTITMRTMRTATAAAAAAAIICFCYCHFIEFLYRMIPGSWQLTNPQYWRRAYRYDVTMLLWLDNYPNRCLVSSSSYWSFVEYGICILLSFAEHLFIFHNGIYFFKSSFSYSALPLYVGRWIFFLSFFVFSLYLF